MAIATDSYIMLDIDGTNYGKVGLSKTLDNYTLDELLENSYCGQYNALMPLYAFGQPGTALTDGNALWPYPLTITRSSQNAGGDAKYSPLYGKIVWLQGNSSTTITESIYHEYKMVTEWPATKMVYTLPSLDGFDSIKASNWNENKSFPSDYRASGTGSLTFHTDYKHTGDKTFSLDVQPYALYVVDDVHFFIQLKQMDQCCTFYAAEEISIYGSSNNWNTSGIGSFIAGDATLGATVSVNFLSNSFTGANQLPLSYTLGNFNTTDKVGIDRTGKYVCSWQSGGNWEGLYAGLFVVHHFALKYDSLLFFAGCGVVIEADNTPYKPIIEDGVVTGISGDLEAESELDEWDGTSQHTVPDNPKPPPEPDYDDPWHGVNYGSGGYGASPFCTSYAMTGAELTALAAWGGLPEAQGGPKAGYDYMPSIISLMEMPLVVSGTAPSTVKFSRGTLGGYDSNIVDTGVSGNPITSGTQRYNLGSVTLPLRMSARGYPFLDWDTVVELYMPFVGMFSLDPFAVLGKTITAFMDLDVLNGTICGYAYVSSGGENLPVAYGSAQVGVSLPVTSDGAAMARLALTAANSALGSSMASSVLQLGAIAAAGGKAAVQGSNAWSAMQSARGAGMAAQAGRSIYAGGAADAIRSTAASNASGSAANSFINWGLSLKQLQSSNNTQVNGSMGGGSFAGWSTPNQAYVKIIRPHAAPGAKASEYSKTHAYPYEANATLAGCKGLTFAVNPDISGITKATDAERAQIAEILMGGVIA